MKKRFLVLAVLLSLSAVLVSVSADDEDEFPSVGYNWGTGGRAIVVHPGLDGEPIILMIEAFNIKYSSYTEPHDLLAIWLVVNLDPFEAVPLAIITDDPFCEAFGDMIFTGVVDFTLVDKSDLEVWSRLRVELNEEVELDGGLVIHPFEMRLKDQGPGEWTEERLPPTGTLPSNYFIGLRMKEFEATGIVTCPDGELYAEEAWVYQPEEMTIIASDNLDVDTAGFFVIPEVPMGSIAILLVCFIGLVVKRRKLF